MKQIAFLLRYTHLTLAEAWNTDKRFLDELALDVQEILKAESPTHPK